MAVRRGFRPAAADFPVYNRSAGSYCDGLKDVNGDGKINTEDAKLVMQLEIGLISKYTP